MTKEEYLKKLILQRWTLKDFAAKINMPYGTLYSILKNVDGGSMYNIVKSAVVCTFPLTNCLR